MPGQISVGGQSGYIIVPNAYLIDDSHLLISVQSNPEEYAILTYRERVPGDEFIYSMNIGFIPRINLILNLSRINGWVEETGIGDRDAQITIHALRETEKLPSVVINLEVPLGVNQFLAGNHVVLSKSFTLMPSLRGDISAGYGIPYRFGREENLGNYSDFGTAKFRPKHNEYLNGIFGGIQLRTAKGIYISLEHDSQKINGGLGLKVFNSLYLQAFALGFRKLGIGASYQFNLR
ncbi:MAG: YjbH domain-containing protein [Cyclobacteriaceae bacterium]